MAPHIPFTVTAVKDGFVTYTAAINTELDGGLVGRWNREVLTITPFMYNVHPQGYQEVRCEKFS
jgi:hypothetical protein